MTARETVEACIDDIRIFAAAGPSICTYRSTQPVLSSLLTHLAGPQLPRHILRAGQSGIEDYIANWDHQIWYHVTELCRVFEGRRDRARAQGGDSWVSRPKPDVEEELRSHLNELAKVRALIEAPPSLKEAEELELLFEDPLLDKAIYWEHPGGLSVRRTRADGVCWQGQDPGGDWFWLRTALAEGAVSIEFDLQPVSTLHGGLIAAFCATPLSAQTPLSVASSSKMSDYYKNFDAYHFSVNRGASGYCNLRRCGPGLIMLASFPDPCPEYNKWYRVQILKNGPQVQLAVDDRLVVCYMDCGYIAPALEGGHFGLRHFQGFEGWHRNVRIAAVG